MSAEERIRTMRALYSACFGLDWREATAVQGGGRFAVVGPGDMRIDWHEGVFTYSINRIGAGRSWASAMHDWVSYHTCGAVEYQLVFDHCYAIFMKQWAAQR